ncbi:tubulin polyglutamylase complex subunit 2 isoform X3 [Lutra lutra]|uniref:tubulin polyglutamylase complex subunit 2 isoform X3 n=1 Tax=Lutra lutra TaxID=9657 RepID=UPI001FD268BE|nr:tubulin polyglutamylase complex subunit 2 isoform X3 [Lutra lutra]
MAEPLGRCPALPPAPLSRRVPVAAPAARGAGTRAMEETPPPGCSKPHLEKLTLGITRILESSPGVTEVTIIEKPPAERHMISSWEQKNNCVLPEDVKNFYLMTNGFHMTWSVKLDEHTIPLGSMAINSISKLTQLNQSSVYSLPNAPTLADLEDDALEASENQPEKPHFDSRSVIFELDPCNGNGKVCLVYKRGKPALAQDTEIWFLDRALYWHFLTDTFTAYYRLLITHLGLPQWQYAFTSYGISPQVKQWFNMYKPITYNTDLLAEETNSFVNKLDPSKVFKSKNKTLIPKKKGPVQPAVLTGAAAEELGEQWCPSHQWESSGGYRREKEGGSVKERRAVKSHAGYLRCRTQSETKMWCLMSKN